MLACLGRTYLADSRLSWSMAVVRGEMKRLAPNPLVTLIDHVAADAGSSATTDIPAIATELTAAQSTTTYEIVSAAQVTPQPSPTATLPSTNSTFTQTTSAPHAFTRLEPMPSLFYLADQENLQRSKAKCPQEVRVSEWNGRIGNHYFQVSQAIVAALFCHTTHVRFPPHINTRYQQQDGLLDMPEELTLPGVDLHEDLKVPSSCPPQPTHKWYHQHCRMVPAWHHRQVMQTFLQPYLGKTLVGLVHASRDIGADRILTIHLRADDIRQYNKYEWGQPPCSMYQKIISDYGYKTLLIVAKSNPVTKRSDAACDSWLVDYGRLHGINITRPNDMTLAGEPWRNKGVVAPGRSGNCMCSRT